MNASFREGFRLGVPYAMAGGVLSASFGVLATQAGFTALQAIVTSMIVFAGSAQFAAISIITGGGGIPAAIAAAGMMNSRFLAMGIALAPSLPGGPVKRAMQGQPIVDASWAMANRGDGTFDRWQLFGSTAPQYVTWTLGTVVGVFVGDLVNPHDYGLDALFPAFFLYLLLAELKDARSRTIAAAGGAIALVLVPLTPAGVPVLVAAAASLIGLAMNNWVLIGGLAVTTFAIKAAGPVALGGREMPPWFTSIVTSMAPALLAALVLTSAFANGEELAIGADTAGVAVAGLAFLRGASVIAGVLIAAAVAAGLRLL